MLTWLLANVALSLLALVLIKLSVTAPHRLRFFAGFTALVAWLVPWPLLPDLLPANLLSFELWRIEHAVEAGSTRLTGVIPVIVELPAMPLARDFLVLSVLELGFIALTLVGAVLFAWKLIAHQLLLRALEEQSDDGNWLWTRAGLVQVCPVRVQREVAGAFSSGLAKPRIWVHDDLTRSPQLATLLRHEVAHIQQHDNWYLLVITLVERLCWWNPLVWYLGRVTRELQELSCDELCQRANADYPAQLAQLMIDSARGGQHPRMLPLGANIFNNPNPNVRRIQLLQRSYPMAKKHIFGASVTATFAFLAVGFVTAQPDEIQPVAGERVSVFRLERTPGTGDDVLMVTNEEGPARAMRVNRGMAAQSGAGDQFFKIEAADGEQRISFTFSDAPLTAVLMPLVGFVSHGMPGPGDMDVAIVRALDEDAETIYGMAPDEVIEVLEEANIGTGSFQLRFAAAPPSDNLLLEYAEAANKIVSATAVNVTLDEAIALVAEKSGCNIFQDGDSLVVD
jgi:beta-lactamase regulating signal transducer with metallopeptidase domain